MPLSLKNNQTAKRNSLLKAAENVSSSLLTWEAWILVACICFYIKLGDWRMEGFSPLVPSVRNEAAKTKLESFAPLSL